MSETPGALRVNHTARRHLTARTTGATAENLRASNLSLVLRQVLGSPGELSRATIAARTGMTRATVSRLVDELISAGLLAELLPESPGRGRPAVPLAPRPRQQLALGLEVKISSLIARVIDLPGTTLAEEVEAGDFAESDPVTTMTALAQLGERALAAAGLSRAATRKKRYLGAGVALPGLVSADVLHRAPNLGWREIPLSDLLAPLAALNPNEVGNEGDLAAFAVANPRPGAPNGPASFIFVSGEVGIGSGIVISHHALSGAHGWAGEIGHICADPAGPVCSCGATGCLEAFLGRRSLAHRAGLPATASSSDVIRAAHHGSDVARRALAEGGTALGRTLAGVINAVDVPVVILGGNVAELAPEIEEYVHAELKTRVLQYSVASPQLLVTEASDRLAVTGAAHRVLQRLVDDPIAWTQ